MKNLFLLALTVIVLGCSSNTEIALNTGAISDNTYKNPSIGLCMPIPAEYTTYLADEQNRAVSFDQRANQSIDIKPLKESLLLGLSGAQEDITLVAVNPYHAGGSSVEDIKQYRLNKTREIVKKFKLKVTSSKVTTEEINGRTFHRFFAEYGIPERNYKEYGFYIFTQYKDIVLLFEESSRVPIEDTVMLEMVSKADFSCQ
ncbi:MAG: hypothetical protein AAFX87_11355 [Bacteroidota bacterium]